MTLTDIIALAKAYNRLGWAIQEQLDDLGRGEGAECNPNALKEVANFLGKVKRTVERQTWDEDTRQELLDEILEIREEINSLVSEKEED